MTADWWLGVLLGTGIGGMHGAARFLVAHYATQHTKQRFLKLLVRGLIARMGGALTLVALVLALAPVHQLAFTVALLLTFVGGLSLDVLFLLRSNGSSPA